MKLIQNPPYKTILNYYFFGMNEDSKFGKMYFVDLKTFNKNLWKWGILPSPPI